MAQSERQSETKTPGEYAAQGYQYDCTGMIGPLWPEMFVKHPAQWPMYSFERPGHILWNAIATELNKQGWNDEEIREWLQSKSTRWALDGDLGDALEMIGKLYARSASKLAKAST